MTVYRVVQEALTNVLRHTGHVPTQLAIAVADSVVRVNVVNEAASADYPTAKPSRVGRELVTA